MGLLDTIKKKKPVKSAASKKAAASSTKKTDVATASASPKEATKMTSQAFQILLQPLLSEKAAGYEANGTYTFIVSGHATKLTVKQAVKDVYGILPTDVRMMNVQGKYVRFSKGYGRRSDWKKAIITLPKGKTISIHEGV